VPIKNDLKLTLTKMRDLKVRIIYFLIMNLQTNLIIIANEMDSFTNTNISMNTYNFEDCLRFNNIINCKQIMSQPLLFPVKNDFSFATNELSLTISRKNFPTLPNYLFSGGVFRSLDLEDNSIENISEKAFDYILLIRELDLSRNRLTNLSFLSSSLNRSNGLCSSVAFNALVELDLSANQIESLDEYNFYCMKSLIRLFLSRNRLIEIDLSMFKGLMRLEVLRLEINQINKIEKSKNYSVLEALKTLFLHRNAIKHIEASTFNSMKNLAFMILSNNPLDRLEAKEIGLTKISTLIIRNCNLNELNEFSFKGLTNLNQLVLEKSNISIIQPNTFVDSSNLRVLDLRDNNIKQIYSRTFERQINLEELDITGNMIERIQPSAFYGLSKIKSLGFGLSRDLSKEGYCDLLSTFEAQNLKTISRNILEIAYYESVNIKISNFFNCEMTALFLIKNLHLNLMSDFEFAQLLVKCFYERAQEKLNEIKSISC
jgi:Leucine-rich repeat (LRR) protein